MCQFFCYHIDLKDEKTENDLNVLSINPVPLLVRCGRMILKQVQVFAFVRIREQGGVVGQFVFIAESCEREVKKNVF